MTGD
ncbi:hypothetical protein RDI58_018015 [Solanum bulbocastanum]|jgi:hypothetical protein